jgi:hypothetical protein
VSSHHTAPPIYFATLVSRVISSAEEDPAEQRTLHEDCSFRAVFLAAKAADTAVIFMRWWLRSIPGVPVNSFGFHRTHPDTYATDSAFGLVDSRPLAYSILNECSRSASGTGRGGSADHFEARVKEGLYVFADYLDVLAMICS